MTAPVSASRLLRRKEAAEYLAISVSALDELTRRGELPHVAMPSAYGKRSDRRWEENELNKFIASHRTGGAA